MATPVLAKRIGARRLASGTPRHQGHFAPSSRVVCDLPELAQAAESIATLLSEARRGQADALATIAELATNALAFRNDAARRRMRELGISDDVAIPGDDVLAALWDRIELTEDGHWLWLGTTNTQGTATMALPFRSALSPPSATRTGGNWRSAGRVLYEGLIGPVGAPFLVRTCDPPRHSNGHTICVNPWHATPSRWAGTRR